jgi:putative tricarboxylic transport membrane protein
MKVRTMRFNDAVVGAAFLLLASAMIAMTFTFPPFPGQKYGPSLFPRIIGAGIIGCSLLLILRERRGARRPWLVLDDWARRPARLASFALMLAAMVFYLLASEPLGFIPTAFLIQLGLFLWFGVRPVTAVIVAVGMTIAVQYFFGNLMRVPLPGGILDSVL